MRIPPSSVLRPRSVRAKIVALLMLPVISLMALWGFAAVTTASGIGDAERGKAVNAELLAPVGEFVTAVQGERTAALGGDAAAYRQAQATTDRTAAAVRTGVDSAGSDAGLLDASLPGRLHALKSDAGALTALRARPSYAGYSAVVRHGFAVTGALTDAARSADASDGRVLLELARAREAVAQEQALLADGVLAPGEYAAFVGAVAVQRELLEAGVADLKVGHRGAYRRVLDGGAFARVRAVEERVRTAGGAGAGSEAGGTTGTTGSGGSGSGSGGGGTTGTTGSGGSGSGSGGGGTTGTTGSSKAGTGSAVSLAGWDGAVGQVLSGLGAAEADAGVAATAESNPFGWDTLGASGVAVVLGLVGVLLSLLVSVLVGRGLIVELLDLRDSALEVAGRRLPQAMRRLHAGQGVDIDVEAPMRRLVGDELAQVGTALTAVQRAALKAAAERAELLSGISGVYVSLARRSQVLLHRQLDLLSEMERRQPDPAELRDLYRVDYLATRMRRHSESLLILSGIAPGRGWREPIPLTDVLRAAVAEIESTDRVQIWTVPRVSVVGGSVADVIHLLAELVENAASFSPPSTQVQLRAARLPEGILIEIEDSGFGMNEDAFTEANNKLRSDKVDLLDAKQIGLFVVNRLRERQGLQAELRPSPTGGVTASVFVPEALVRDDMPVGERGLAPASALVPEQRGWGGY